ncbi:ImmA/IrrE family metallo-endopeptidase, partial [uncultured Streptococcus sp.]|uniref:ImmA/IrrE family metallo-endopeptidase n=1 Tax=uncultured Streptococcus sp. TaxID=83427 RepID=UPI00265F912D
MRIDELLKEYKISLFVFPAEMWERSGFYFPDLRRICVNESLSKQEREKVILHELGHIDHDPKHYKRLLLQYENQADRFMIRELLVDYLKSTDIYDFNWVR